MLKSVCRCTIFYQTDNYLLLSVEQYQVKLKSEVAYPKDQCIGVCLFSTARGMGVIKGSSPPLLKGWA